MSVSVSMAKLHEIGANSAANWCCCAVVVWSGVVRCGVECVKWSSRDVAMTSPHRQHEQRHNGIAHVRSVREEDTEMYTLPTNTTMPPTTIVHHCKAAGFASPRVARAACSSCPDTHLSVLVRMRSLRSVAIGVKRMGSTICCKLFGK
jgi:hypothetical protein